jgi:hypothetical protein
MKVFFFLFQKQKYTSERQDSMPVDKDWTQGTTASFAEN